MTLPEPLTGEEREYYARQVEVAKEIAGDAWQTIYPLITSHLVYLRPKYPTDARSDAQAVRLLSSGPVAELTLWTPRRVEKPGKPVWVFESARQEDLRGHDVELLLQLIEQRKTTKYAAIRDGGYKYTPNFWKEQWSLQREASP